MFGEVGGDQVGEAAPGADLLDLQAVEEGPQGVGQLQGGGGVEVAAQLLLVALHQGDQFEAATQGIDGRGQVDGQVAGLEGRLALVQIPQGPDLGRQHRAAPGSGDEGVGQRPCAPAGGGQDHGLG